MKGRIAPLVVLLCAVLALLRLEAQGPGAQTFRAGTDVVLVDVAVRDGPRAVTGLTAKDFVLTDNGVRQAIDGLEATSVPIDVTLVVDVSGSPGIAWPGTSAVASLRQGVEREAEGVRSLLRRGDRLRLLAVDTEVQIAWPMQEVTAPPDPPRLRVGGLSALYDTLASALLHPAEPARRHVVIARTKGLDTVSSVDAQAVMEIAQQSDALFHLVTMEQALEGEQVLRGFRCGLMGQCWPTSRFWLPFQRRLTSARGELLLDGQALAAGAQYTGGTLHRAGAITVPTLTGTFRKTLDDFRNNYVLRYRPQGVQRPGWHRIQVRVSGSRSYEVRSRRGYFIEEAPPQNAAPAIPDVPRTVPDFVTAYERNAFAQVAAGLRQLEHPGALLRDLERAGNPWSANPRKEAAFAVELAEPGVFSRRASDREAAYAHLLRFVRFVRHPLEPDVFERYWHFAVLTALEGTLRPVESETFAVRALERFPDEPRFLLSRAILEDQRSATRAAPSAVDTDGVPAPAAVASVRGRYLAAAMFPQTAAEAHIRLAWLLHRARQHADAEAHLMHQDAQGTAEPFLRYLRQLFLGHVFLAQGRRKDALSAYRAALVVVPAAQSARVSLMNALLTGGERATAEEIAEQVQAANPAVRDPWWIYWQGQYRLYEAALTRLRELSR